MDERRQYVRMDAKLHVAYAVLDNPKHFTTSTSDIGAGGIRLTVNESLPLGTHLRVEITLDNHQRIPFKGEVVWSDEYKLSTTVKRNTSHEIGVRFVQISPADREALKRYVAGKL